MQPVFKQVEKLKIELAREEADGWVLAVLKSAFIQGSNSDFSIDDLATNNGHNVKYDNLVDKLYIRRMPEILRTHIFPRFEKTYLLKDIIKASDEEGVFLDSEAPGDCKIVYDEFLKIVSNLRVKEKEGGGGFLAFFCKLDADANEGGGRGASDEFSGVCCCCCCCCCFCCNCCCRE